MALVFLSIFTTPSVALASHTQFDAAKGHGTIVDATVGEVRFSFEAQQFNPAYFYDPNPVTGATHGHLALTTATGYVEADVNCIAVYGNYPMFGQSVGAMAGLITKMRGTMPGMPPTSRALLFRFLDRGKAAPEPDTFDFVEYYTTAGCNSYQSAGAFALTTGDITAEDGGES